MDIKEAEITLQGDNIKNVYFIGIGGISMSGLARILQSKGYNVSGSDIKHSEVLDKLNELGIRTYVPHDYNNIDKNIDLVVYTAAIKQDNPEMIAAKERNLKIMDRAGLLGMLIKEYEMPVCVSGTHGKTTTTAMITEILMNARQNPTVTAGGIIPSINSSFRLGGNKYMVVESCEYFDSFLKFYPYVGVILNVEADHLDYFKDLSHIEQSFKKFAGNIRKEGALIINYDIVGRQTITEGLRCSVITYGNPDAHWYADKIRYDEKGYPNFEVVFMGKSIARLSLKAPGLHNVQNSIAAFAAAHWIGVPVDKIVAGLSNFTGALRRFEIKGNVKGVTVIDDYAHHPTEIKATLQAAVNLKHNKIHCVFQPHTYSRTLKLLDDFANAFDLADDIYILDIYSAREDNKGDIHSLGLVEKLQAKGKKVSYLPSFEEAKKELIKKCIPNDLLITMGAGDVHLIGENILSTEVSTLSTDF